MSIVIGNRLKSLIIRSVTSIILAPLSITVTLFCDTKWFTLCMAVIMLIGLAEWVQLTLCYTMFSTLIFIVMGCNLIIFVLLVYSSKNLLYGVTSFGAFHWIVSLICLYRNIGVVKLKIYRLIEGWIVLFSALSSLVLMHQILPQGRLMTLGLLIIIWSTDTFSYFAGELFGKTPLAPNISSGKTVEGLIGGLLSALLFSLMFSVSILHLSGSLLIYWMVYSVITALMSVIGDLKESRLKRHAGVKDSGKLLPGHGGVLDRIDGLLAASPVFVTLWWPIT